jgi:hypothetical protein
MEKANAAQVGRGGVCLHRLHQACEVRNLGQMRIAASDREKNKKRSWNVTENKALPFLKCLKAGMYMKTNKIAR